MVNDQQSAQQQRVEVVTSLANLSRVPEAEPTFDFDRNNFFNITKASLEAKNKPPSPEVRLQLATTPQVLAGQAFRAAGLTLDITAKEYLNEQAAVLDQLIIAAGASAAQEQIANHVPRNALVRRNFDSLQFFLDDRFGTMYESLWQQANVFGNFAVAQAVIEEQGLVIDLRDSQL